MSEVRACLAALYAERARANGKGQLGGATGESFASTFFGEEVVALSVGPAPYPPPGGAPVLDSVVA